MSIESVVIVGSGPAGLTAALYLSRAGFQPLIIEGHTPGGQLMSTTFVENWPGEKSILGAKLMLNMREHAAHFGTRFLHDEVVSADLTQKPFTLQTKRGATIKTHALIICTGATPKKIGCPGEHEYWGKGVTTCAVCDGAFYKDKKVIIVGGGDTAMENASFMTNFTNDITLVHILDRLTASRSMQERVINNPAIKIIYNSTVSAIKGNGTSVTGVTITNQQTGEKTKQDVDGVFIAIGLSPNTALFKNQLEFTKSGHILHKERTQTSVEGVFAAGDVVDVIYRQAIVSAGEGCKAALDAERYLFLKGVHASKSTD